MRPKIVHTTLDGFRGRRFFRRQSGRTRSRSNVLLEAMSCTQLILRVVFHFFKVWESYQVELHGHYSVERLQEFAQFEKRTSLVRVILIQFMTLVPPVAAIVLADVLPLNPPVGGLKAQSVSYWIRTFYSVLIISVTSIGQFHYSSSRLPLKAWWVAIATIAITTITVAFILALHVVIGFPTPFQYQVASAVWQACLYTALWMMWKTTFRENPESWQDLKRFIWLWLAQFTMIVVYPVFGYVYRVISYNQKTIFTMILPFWKMALKLWANYGAYRIEDQTPVFIVFTVDVFHALFLSSAMQSSANLGYGTLLVVIVVDIFQSVVAFTCVRAVLARIEEQAQMIDILETKAAASGNGTPECHYVPIESTSRSQYSSLDRSIAILNAHHHIRDHPEVYYPRYKREVTRPGPNAQIVPPPNALGRNRVQPAPRYNESPVRRKSTFATDSLEDLDYVRLKFVRETMQLLHMVEFYMLIEFTEVFIALIYSIYLVVMSYLPNRVYYAQLEAISDAEWGSTVAYLFQYSGYELLSYIVLALVLRYMTKMSGTKLIGFSLEKHWSLVQSLLVLWVFFVIQMSLKHLGCDYTFKFEWLKKQDAG